MVASAKEVAKREFADLLNAELDRVGVPTDRARIGWMHKALKHKGKPLVSREQVRKWVRGIDIPDQTNLRIVCDLLKLDWARLQTGKPLPPVSPLFAELQAIWEAMADIERRSLVRYAKYIRDEADNNNTARPEGKDSEGDRAVLQRHRRA